MNSVAIIPARGGSKRIPRKNIRLFAGNDVVTFSPASVPVVLPRYRLQDIDTLEDWRRAELMFAALQEMEA